MSRDSIKHRLFARLKRPVGVPKKDLGSPLLLVVNTLAIFIVSQLLAAIIVELVLSLIHPGTTDFFSQSAAAQFFYVLIAESAAVVSVYRIIKRRGLNLEFIGLGRRPVWRDLRRALLGVAIYYGLLVAASLLLAVLVPGFKTNQAQDVGFNQLKGAADTTIAFIALVILPPLGEEPLVRGYLYSGLKARLKFWPALLITSLFFGAAHLQLGNGGPLVWGAAINTFLLSAVLVYLRQTSGALYAGILVHLLNNVIAFGAHFH